MAEGERFLVTGAAGCLGAWAVRLLLDEGVPVIASDITPDLRRFRLVCLGQEDNLPEFVPLDVTSPADVAAVVREHEITHIIHLAGLQLPLCAADPPRGALVNVAGTVNVFEAALGAGRRVGLAYASSAAVFGNGSGYAGGMVGDGSPLAPDSHYGVYKAANEGTARVYAASHGLGSIGLRPFVVYGPGRDQGMTSGPTVAMLAAAAGVPYRIGFSGSLLLTYAADCAAAFIAAARAAAGAGDAVCLNVPGHRASVAGLVDLIEQILPGSKSLISFEPAPIRFPALLASPALDEITGKPRNGSLEASVRATISHFRQALAAGLAAVPA